MRGFRRGRALVLALRERFSRDREVALPADDERFLERLSEMLRGPVVPAAASAAATPAVPADGRQPTSSAALPAPRSRRPVTEEAGS
jgi:hypothetical protein